MPAQFIEAIKNYFQIFIEGFKSFKDETVIDLQPGLNIVGKHLLFNVFVDTQHIFSLYFQLATVELGRVTYYKVSALTALYLLFITLCLILILL